MSKLNKNDIPYYNLTKNINELYTESQTYKENNNINATLYHDEMTMGTLYINQTNTGPCITSMSSQPLTLDCNVVITGNLAICDSHNIINGLTINSNSSNNTSNFLLAINGNETNPSISFINSNGTGFYNSSNVLGVSIGGSSLLTMNATEILPFQNDKFNIGSTGRRILNMYARSYLNTSDERLKDNIKNIKTTISDPIKFINDLSVVSYNFKNDDKLNYGLVIQDIQNVIENNNIINFDAISGSDETMYTLDYNQIHVINISAVQELIKENKEMKDRILNLENKVNLLTNYISKI